MGKMIRSKKEWVCSNCTKRYLKWQGICECGQVGTLLENLLTVPKATASENQKALIRRSKRSERTIARRMLEIDGPDPAFAKIASSTGRTGHITNLRIDAVSLHYRTENKNRKMPQWFIKAWILINQRARDFDKNALLHLDPPNMPKDFLLNGQRHKLDTIACITQERHEKLIFESALLERIEAVLFSDCPRDEMLHRILQLYE